MAKTLLLLRHAKSAWPEPAVPDFDRPLTRRGIAAAEAIGRYLVEHNLQPDLIVSSTAVRAKTTALLAAQAGELTAATRWDLDVYGAAALTIKQVAGKLPADTNTVLLVGHNPGITEAVHLLTASRLEMKTATLAVIQFSADTWAEAVELGGTLQASFTPERT